MSKVVFKGERITPNNIIEYLKVKFNVFTCQVDMISEKHLPVRLLNQNDYGLPNDCTLSSFTTIINYWLDNSLSLAEIYQKVEKCAYDHHYSKKSGMYSIFMKGLLDDLMKEFGINRTTEFGYFKCLFAKAKRIMNAIDNNIPVALSLSTDHRGYYSNHTITIMGYQVYKIKGKEHVFFAVSDNWNTDTFCYLDYDMLSVICSINF